MNKGLKSTEQLEDEKKDKLIHNKKKILTPRVDEPSIACPVPKKVFKKNQDVGSRQKYRESRSYDAKKILNCGVDSTLFVKEISTVENTMITDTVD